MSEIVEDIKSQAIEIVNDLGLNFSSNNPRIKHTGDGSLTIETTSSQETALEISVPNGGIDMIAGKKIMIDTTDATDGIKIGTGFPVPITIGTSTTESTVPGNVTIHGNLTVDGDTFTNNVVIYTQEDPLFYINSGFTGTNTSDIGFIGERGTLENVGWIWNEANKEWAAIGTTDNGIDPVVNPISNYKPIKAGGLKVVTDISNATPTVFNVAVNGAIDINTTNNTNGVHIGTTPSGVPVTIGSASSTVVIAGITFSSGGGGGGINTDNVIEGTSNLYFLPTRAVTAIENDANLVLNGTIAASLTHNSASDFTLSHNGGNGRLILTGTKAGVDAVQINATTTGGGIDINAGSGGITLDSIGGISLDSTGAVDINADLTTNINVTGDGQSLILSSSGGGLQQTLISSDGTVANAIQLTAANGGIALNSVTSSLFNVNGSGESLTLTTTGGGTQQTIISSAGTGVDAIQINASSVTGGIDLNAGSGGVTIDTTGSLSLDAGITSNFTIATGNLTLAATTNSVVVTAGQSFTVDSTGGISLDAGIASNLTTATGNLTLAATTNSVVVTAGQAFTVDSTGGISLDAGTASNLTTATGDLTLSATSNSVVITGAEAAVDAIQLNATTTGGGIDVNASSGGITVDTTGSLSLDAGTASNLTTATGNLTLAATTNSVVVTAGQAFTVDTTGGISLDAGTASNLTTATGDLTLSATANSVIITGAEAAVDAIQLNATTTGGGIDVNASSGGITVDTTGSLSLDAGTASNLTTATGDLTLAATTNSVAVSAGQNCTVDATGGISLDAQTSSNFTVTGNAQSLTIATLGGGSQQTIISSAGIGSSAVSISGSVGGVAISGAAASSMTTSVGAITMNGKTGVDVQYNSVSQANFSNDGTLTLKASEPYTITHAANGTGDDLTISQTGGVDASLLLTSAGTGADAIGLSATGTGGGISISANNTLALTASTINIARNSSNPVNIGFTNSETNVFGNLTVSGNLLINGTTVTNNATVNTYVDPIFYLNSDMTGANTHDIGLVGERGTAGNNVAFIWDEQLDEWAAIETSLTGLGNLLEDPIIKYAPLKVGSFSVQGGVGTSVNIDVTGAISLETTDTTNGITIGTSNANVPINIGTTGSIVSIAGGVINATQTITSATSLAISLSTLITFFDGSLGAITATLANGTVGQTKILIMTNNTNQASVTPTTKLGFTTITFNGNGDSATLIYTSSGWVIVNERNTTIS